jgi:hypothetical protein
MMRDLLPERFEGKECERSEGLLACCSICDDGDDGDDEGDGEGEDEEAIEFVCTGLGGALGSG